MSDCLFCKIIAGEIPSKKIYEDEDVFAFYDISPQAPIHFLVIPKKHIPHVMDLKNEDSILMGKMLFQAQKIAKELGLNQMELVLFLTVKKVLAKQYGIFTYMF